MPRWGPSTSQLTCPSSLHPQWMLFTLSLSRLSIGQTPCPWAGGGGSHWSLMQVRASKSSSLGTHSPKSRPTVTPSDLDTSPKTWKDTALWQPEDMVSRLSVISLLPPYSGQHTSSYGHSHLLSLCNRVEALYSITSESLKWCCL